MKPKINLPAIKKTFAAFGKQIAKRAPEILTGLGVGGVFLSTGLGISATVKATRKVDAYLEEKRRYAADDEEVKITVKELLSLVWKEYIGTAAAVVGSSVCMVAASAKNAKRNAALLAGYGVLESSLRDQKEALVEVLGEKKAAEVTNKAAEKVVERVNVSSDAFIPTGHGTTPMIDKWSGRAYYGDIEYTRRAVNEINRRLYSEDELCINEYYSEVGLMSIDSGSSFGWRNDTGPMKVDFEYAGAFAGLGTDDERPVVIVSFDTSTLLFLDNPQWI